MANRRLAVPNLYGGVSRQAPTLRHLNQVEDATNALFSVSDGTTKRPGTTMCFAVSGVAADFNARLHAIDRDGAEQYLVVYGDSTVRVFDLDGNECDVVISDAAQAYIDANSADADELRLLTIADSTLLVNTTVETGASYSDNYTLTGTHKTLSALFSRQPTVDTYHRVEDDSDGEPSGYWKYTPGVGTFAQTAFATLNDGFSTPSTYNGNAYNPFGLKGFFQRVATVTGTYSWDVSEMALTKSGAFAAYEWREGDQLKVTGGTGVAAGYYTITSKTDDDTITLGDEPKVSDVADVTVSGIGRYWSVEEYDMTNMTFDTMQDVALAFEHAIRDASGLDACVNWTVDTAGTSKVNGHFTLISPYRGAGATIPDMIAPAATSRNYTTATWPFSNAGDTQTAGTGYPLTDTLAPADRWTRVAAPYQEDAVLDSDTLPSQMKRQYAGEYYKDSYSEAVLDDKPAFYWRLGESSGTTAADETGRNNGTYVDTPTLGATGAVRGSDTAVTFNGSSEYVNLGALQINTMLTTQFTVEAWVTLAGATGEIIGVYDNTGTIHMFRVFVDSGNPAFWLSVPTSGAASQEIFYTSDTDINDGEWHHVLWSVNVASRSYNIYVDGAATTLTMTYDSEPGGALVAPTITADVYLAAYHNDVTATTSNYFHGTLDEVAIYHGALTSLQAALHYRAGVSHTGGLFTVDQIDWNDRYTGGKDSNPVPEFIRAEDAISDLQLHRSRLGIAAGNNFVLSQANDLFNFFIEDSDNLADADPIDIPMPSANVAVVDYVVPFRKSLVFFAKGGQQFELNTPETLTYNTAAIIPSTRYQHLPNVRPATLGELVYYTALEQDTTQLREHYRDDDTGTSRSVDVTAHVKGYLPDDIRTLVALPNSNAVYVLPTSQDALYVYRMFWSGSKQVQSAWSTYTFDAGERIVDIAGIGEMLYMLVENTDGYFVQSLASDAEDATQGLDFPVMLDNRVVATGVYADPNTTWTLTVEDDSLDTAVLGSSFGDDAGESVSLTKVSSTSYTATGDYSAGDAVLGRGYDMTVTLSRPYVRVNETDSILNANVQIRHIVLNYTNTGGFTVSVTSGSRSAREYAFEVAGGDIASEGNFRAMVLGKTDNTTIAITSDSVKPCRISAAEYIVSLTAKE